MDVLSDSPDVLLKQAGIEIPWPELTEEDQKVVDENYRKLHENIRLPQNRIKYQF